MAEKSALITALEAFSDAPISQTGLHCGCDVDIKIAAGNLPDCSRLLLQHEFFLSFITAVHVSPACEVVYQFGHFETSCRLQLRVTAGPEHAVPSIAAIYQGASWHEREVHDFFGIVFEGNHDLKPLILSREERHLKPLLKESSAVRPAAAVFQQAAVGPDEAGDAPDT